MQLCARCRQACKTNYWKYNMFGLLIVYCFKNNLCKNKRCVRTNACVFCVYICLLLHVRGFEGGRGLGGWLCFVCICVLCECECVCVIRFACVFLFLFAPPFFFLLSFPLPLFFGAIYFSIFLLHTFAHIFLINIFCVGINLLCV